MKFLSFEVYRTLQPKSHLYIPFLGYCAASVPNFHIHVSVSDLYIPRGARLAVAQVAAGYEFSHLPNLRRCKVVANTINLKHAITKGNE